MPPCLSPSKSTGLRGLDGLTTEGRLFPHLFLSGPNPAVGDCACHIYRNRRLAHPSSKGVLNRVVAVFFWNFHSPFTLTYSSS